MLKFFTFTAKAYGALAIFRIALNITFLLGSKHKRNLT